MTDIIQGCGTALVTPFNDGQVDYDAYVRMVQRQVEQGIDFLVPLGTSAETPCLTSEEKVKLLRLTRENAQGKPLVAGVGTNSLIGTLGNVELLKEADAFLIVTPYYNKPTQRGLYEYFSAIAKQVDKPIILYNVPGRTGTNMTAATTLRLAQENKNIIAVKEASGNMEQIRAILNKAPEGFCVLSGNDDQTLEIMLEGGKGVISVASNVVPGKMTEMVHKAAEGDFRAASHEFRQMVPLFEACFVESNPIPVKAAMSILGMCKNEMRLPLTSCEPSTYDKMLRVIHNLGLLK